MIFRPSGAADGKMLKLKCRAKGRCYVAIIVITKSQMLGGKGEWIDSVSW